MEPMDTALPSLAFKTEDLPAHRRGTSLESVSPVEPEQWVKAVTAFSSEYSTGGRWSASNVVGKPRVYPSYGDNALAWTPRTLDANQFLELEFEEAVEIEGIHIYETNVAGGVVEVLAKDSGGSWVTLWKGKQAVVLSTSRIFAPPLELSKFDSKYIKLKVDCSVSRSWVEIDAVKLLGKALISCPKGTLSNLADSLCRLLFDNQFTDVSFKVDRQTFHAHKGIVSLRCPALLGMGTRLDENEHECYRIEDIDATTFIGILHFLYSAQIGPVVKPVHLAKIIRVCDKLVLPELKDICLSHLEHEVDVQNVVEIYHTTFGDDTLTEVRDVCAEFIGRNMSAISKTSAFVSLPQNVMLELVQKSSVHLKRKAPPPVDPPPPKIGSAAFPSHSILGAKVQSSPPEKA